MDSFKKNVLPFANDPRENFKATAVLNFWGIIQSIDSFQKRTPDFLAACLKAEFLDMAIARFSEEWALNILLKK